MSEIDKKLGQPDIDRAMKRLGGEDELDEILAKNLPRHVKKDIFRRHQGKLKQTSGESVGLANRRFDQLLKGTKTIDNRRKQIAKAVELIAPLPEPDHMLHCLLGDDFNAWEIVPAVLALAGRPAASLYVATLSFNKLAIGHLAELVKQGQIESCDVLCSHYFQATDKVTYRAGRKSLEAVGARIAYTRSHAKVIAIDVGDCYVIEGSANLRSCYNVEQLTLTNSAGLFDFHAGWIKTAVDESPC